MADQNKVQMKYVVSVTDLIMKAKSSSYLVSFVR